MSILFFNSKYEKRECLEAKMGLLDIYAIHHSLTHVHYGSMRMGEYFGPIVLLPSSCQFLRSCPNTTYKRTLVRRKQDLKFQLNTPPCQKMTRPLYWCVSLYNQLVQIFLKHQGLDRITSTEDSFRISMPLLPCRAYNYLVPFGPISYSPDPISIVRATSTG